MSATAANLAGLLTTNADINYYTQQSIFWNAKYEANLARLEQQQKYETQWEKAYDSVMNDGKEIKYKGCVYNNKEEYNDEIDAKRYADAKVSEYKEELMMELADQDIEYETMKTMYDTMLETLRAKQESQKALTSESAQDTGLLQS